MKKKQKIIIFSLIAGFLIFTIIVAATSPDITALLLRKIFETSPKTKPYGYDSIKKSVTVIENVTYPSTNKLNQMDLYLPKNKNIKPPLIIWIHGGGFVGGDKKDAEFLSTALAANGYAVASINYELAPEAKYPVPLRQLSKSYVFLKKEQDRYNIDASQTFLAGDSAGAQIAAQFSVIQTSEKYARKMKMQKTIPEENMKALLLYCGPYEMKKIEKYNKILGIFRH